MHRSRAVPEIPGIVRRAGHRAACVKGGLIPFKQRVDQVDGAFYGKIGDRSPAGAGGEAEGIVVAARQVRKPDCSPGDFDGVFRIGLQLPFRGNEQRVAVQQQSCRHGGVSFFERYLIERIALFGDTVKFHLDAAVQRRSGALRPGQRLGHPLLFRSKNDGMRLEDFIISIFIADCIRRYPQLIDRIVIQGFLVPDRESVVLYFKGGLHIGMPLGGKLDKIVGRAVRIVDLERASLPDRPVVQDRDAAPYVHAPVIVARAGPQEHGEGIPDLFGKHEAEVGFQLVAGHVLHGSGGYGHPVGRMQLQCLPFGKADVERGAGGKPLLRSRRYICEDGGRAAGSDIPEGYQVKPVSLLHTFAEHDPNGRCGGYSFPEIRRGRAHDHGLHAVGLDGEFHAPGCRLVAGGVLDASCRKGKGISLVVGKRRRRLYNEVAARDLPAYGNRGGGTACGCDFYTAEAGAFRYRPVEVDGYLRIGGYVNSGPQAGSADRRLARLLFCGKAVCYEPVCFVIRGILERALGDHDGIPGIQLQRRDRGDRKLSVGGRGIDGSVVSLGIRQPDPFAAAEVGAGLDALLENHLDAAVYRHADITVSRAGLVHAQRHISRQDALRAVCICLIAYKLYLVAPVICALQIPVP